MLDYIDLPTGCILVSMYEYVRQQVLNKISVQVLAFSIIKTLHLLIEL